MQIHCGEHFRIRRHFLAGFKENNVADHQILFRNLYELSVADGLKRQRVVDLVENVEFPARPVFVQEGDSRGENHCKDDPGAFDEAARKGGNHGGDEQNADDGIPEFFKEKLPCRGARRFRQGVCSVCCAARRNLGVGQP